MSRPKLNQLTVLTAAAALANRDGFQAVTVSAVARHLGVQPASLYEHIQGKDALLDGLQQLALAELGSRISDTIAGRSGADALRGLADSYRSYASEQPGAWTAIERPATRETALSPGAAQVASLTLAVIRGYPVPPDDVVHAARLVGATINGFLSLSRSDSFGHRPDAEDDSWASAMAALDRALSTWPTQGARP